MTKEMTRAEQTSCSRVSLPEWLAVVVTRPRAAFGNAGSRRLP
jgi:hypothetical protein